jgi:ABC-type branched-subunit amino acid transport system substrate-binding protein
MVGAYEPCAEFIKLGKQVGMTNIKYCNVSFVGSDALKNSLGDAGDGVIISQVVPFPWDTSIAVIKEYQEVIKKYTPDQPIGFVSLEGFLTAKFFVEAVRACGTEITREGLISAVEQKKSFDLGGVIMTFSESDHQGMDQINFTVIEKGEFRSLTSFAQ